MKVMQSTLGGSMGYDTFYTIEDVGECPRCGGHKFLEDDDGLECENCGLVRARKDN